MDNCYEGKTPTPPYVSGIGSIEEDPWKHRANNMKCRTCMWFVLKSTNTPRVGSDTLGRCRRHSPTISGFPAIFMHDWCGDHKVDENKI